MAAIPFGEFTSFSQVGYFPETPVHPGATWVQDVDIPHGIGKFRIESKLIKTDAQVGEKRVASIQQVSKGSIDFSKFTSFMPDVSVQNASVGNFTSNTTIYFSPEQARVLRAEEIANVLADLILDTKQGGTKAVKMNMQMRMDMNLLPEKEKAR